LKIRCHRRNQLFARVEENPGRGKGTAAKNRLAGLLRSAGLEGQGRFQLGLAMAGRSRQSRLKRPVKETPSGQNRSKGAKRLAVPRLSANRLVRGSLRLDETGIDLVRMREQGQPGSETTGQGRTRQGGRRSGSVQGRRAKRQEEPDKGALGQRAGARSTRI